MADLVAFKDIAKRLGLNPSTVSRLMIGLGRSSKYRFKEGVGKLATQS